MERHYRRAAGTSGSTWPAWIIRCRTALLKPAIAEKAWRPAFVTRDHGRRSRGAGGRGRACGQAHGRISKSVIACLTALRATRQMPRGCLARALPSPSADYAFRPWEIVAKRSDGQP